MAKLLLLAGGIATWAIVNKMEKKKKGVRRGKTPTPRGNLVSDVFIQWSFKNGSGKAGIDGRYILAYVHFLVKISRV